MQTQINVHEAKTRLSQLIEQALAGDEVIIARAGTPVVKLVAIEASKPRRVLGPLAGKARVPEDFNAPLPPEVLDDFEGR